MARQMEKQASRARPAVVDAGNGGPVTRAAQDLAGAAEVLTLGTINLARSTLMATVEAVQDVGGRIGSFAVATAQGAAKAVADIGGDLGELGKGTVQGTVDIIEEVGEGVGSLSRQAVSGTVETTREVGGKVGSLAIDAVEGAVHTVDRLGSTAGRSVRDAVAGTVAGVRTVLAEAGITNGVSRHASTRVPQRALPRRARGGKSKPGRPRKKAISA